MSTNEPTLVATLPPGRYIVGDPCYSIGEDHDDWIAWLEATDFMIQDRRHVLVAPYNGHLCVGVSTAYGDGCYSDQLGNSYGVDAGMIGLVHVDAADKQSDPDALVVEFTEPIECFHQEGIIHLGHLVINTGDECEDCGVALKGGYICSDCEEQRMEDEEDESCEVCGNYVFGMDEGNLCQDCADEAAMMDEDD